uniref:Lipase n=1 Tax=Kalanchoe fedtschenkoi TaxID=63787 RepID=A0A7N0V6M8_KALFE
MFPFCWTLTLLSLSLLTLSYKGLVHMHTLSVECETFAPKKTQARSSSMALIITLAALIIAAGASREATITSPDSIQDGTYPPEVAGICAASVAVHGYKCQEFEVQTEDGFILSLQRIPEGRGEGGKGARKSPVLIQHGVLVDGMTWFLNSAEEDLPFILAENGFDVWIANTRGTRFCRKHRYLDSSSDEFWNWTWDELVTYDLPAVTSFVRKHTGQKMNYLGHSLGTLIALASFSEGRLVDDLKSAALLCPIAYLNHMTTALGVVAAKAFAGEIGSTFFGLAEFYPKGVDVASFLKVLCAHPGANCYDLLTAITGPNCCINASTIQLFLKNEPQSTSTKNLVHLSQTVRDGVLAKYDFGNPAFNLMHYGTPSPPIYNLSNIPRSFPIFLSYGGLDALSDVHDVQLLLDNLKFHDVDKLSVQFIKDYGHADFVMGVNAKDLVYNAVVSFFKSHMASL